MDIPKLEQLLNDLHIATGMDAAIIDGNFRVLARRHSGMDFCTHIHNSAKCLELCIASDNEQIAKVDSTQRYVCYTCPFGILEAIAPIFRSGRIIAYLFLSMGIPKGENCRNTLVQRALTASVELKASSLERALEAVGVYSEQQMKAYCGILTMAADYIENHDLLSGPEQSLGQLAKNYIKNNLEQKITLSELSYRLGCSTVTLTTHFKKEFGETVMEYVFRKRIALARQLLLDDTLPVEAVAMRCGFQDPAYFSKCFKREESMSPLEWKRKMLGTKK